MARLFRKTRIDSLKNNKAIRYVFYMIGEVLLVVIGILIALRVNEASEHRSKLALEHKLMENIKHDMVQDINNINGVAQWYFTRDSLIDIVLNNTLTKEDYEANPKLFNLTLYYDGVHNKMLGIKNLESYEEQLDARFDSALVHINFYYYIKVPLVNEYSAKISNQIEDRWERWLAEYEWFQLDITNDDKYDYYLNDPRYKGELKLFRVLAINNFNRNILYQKLRGYQSILAIDEAEKISFDETMQYLTISINDFNQYTLGNQSEVNNENHANTSHFYQLLVRNNRSEAIFVDGLSSDNKYLPPKFKQDSVGGNSMRMLFVGAGREFLVKTSGTVLGSARMGYHDGYLVVE